MSDIGDTGAAEAAPAEAAPAAPEAPGFNELDYGQIGAESHTWDASTAQERLSQLNNEHKKYRETYDPYAKAFSGFNDDSRAQILQAFEALPNNPAAVARFFAENARAWAGDEWEGIYGELAPEVAEPETPVEELSVADQVQKILDERDAAARAETDQQKALTAQVEAIASEMKELGYEQTDGEWGDEAQIILALAHARPDKDIKAAHEKWVEQQAVIAQKYLEGKKAPKVAPSGGGSQPRTPTEAEKPAGPVDAMKAARDRVAQRFADVS